MSLIEKELESTILDSPTKILERLLLANNSQNSEYPKVSVFQNNGLVHSGKAIKYEADKGILMMLDGSDKNAVLFLETSKIVGLKLNDTTQYLGLLTGKQPMQPEKQSDFFDLEAYIEMLEVMLKENCELRLKFKLENYHRLNPIEIENIRIVLEKIGKSIVNMAQDDFSYKMLSTIDAIVINNVSKDSLSFSRSKDIIKVKYDFSIQLPFRLDVAIENGLNKVL